MTDFRTGGFILFFGSWFDQYPTALPKANLAVRLEERVSFWKNFFFLVFEGPYGKNGEKENSAQRYA